MKNHVLKRPSNVHSMVALFCLMAIVQVVPAFAQRDHIVPGIRRADPGTYDVPRLKGFVDHESYRAWRRLERDTFRRQAPRLTSPDAVHDPPPTELVNEGFEGATFPPTGWTNVVVTGGPSWDIESTNPHSGSYNAFSDYGPDGIFSRKMLISKRVNLNGALEYRMRFWLRRVFVHIPDYAYDTVKIRISTTDSLPSSFTHVVYTCSTGPDTSTHPDIYTLDYKEFTATFSGYNGTAWIAIEHLDSAAQTINLDDVVLEELVNNNIQALGVDAPLAGERKNLGTSFQPIATFRNVGLQTQTNIPVRFRIYNSLGSPVYAMSQTISSLAPDAEIQVSFPNFVASTPGLFTARAVVANPGDTNPSNDSTGVTFRIPDNISGTRTVGSGADFTSLSDAMRYLNENNVAGPLTFLLTSALYLEDPITVDPINYVTTPQEVTIKPNSGVSAVIRFSTIPGSLFGFRLRQPSAFIIDGSNTSGSTRNLTLEIDTTSFAGPVVMMAGGTRDVTLKNSIIRGYSVANGDSWSAIVVDSVSLSVGDNNIIFDNLEVKRAYNGFFVRGQNALSARMKIRDCDIGGSGPDAITVAGIYAVGFDSVEITRNDIGGLRPSIYGNDLYGIQLDAGCRSALVHRNVIHDILHTMNGGWAVGFRSWIGSAANLMFFNNVLFDITSVGGGSLSNLSAGVLSIAPGNSGEHYVFNSMYLSGLDSSSGTDSRSAGFELDPGITYTEIKNNIVVNAMQFAGLPGSSRAYCISVAGSVWPSNSSSNHNDFFPVGGQAAVGQIGGVARVALSAWQSATAQDPNSISSDPRFVSAADLHIIPTDPVSPVNAAGQAVATITTDVDGESRDVLTPDIGADEFTPQSGLFGQFTSGWNLVSIPVDPADGRVTTLFPVGTSSNAYAFENGYVRQDTLYAGVGYWLKYDGDQSYVISGSVRNRDTIAVHKGWNMIGSLSVSVPVGSVASNPPAIIQSAFFQYGGGYTIADTLRPFKGYWVKTNQEGQLIMAPAAAFPQSAATDWSSLSQRIQGMSTIRFRTPSGEEQVLFFCSEQEVKEPEVEMPPPPVAGAFDVRFEKNALAVSGNRILSPHRSWDILMQSASYPVTVNWTVRTKDEELFTLRVGEQSPKRLSRSGSLVVSSPSVDGMKLSFSSSERPREFRLDQNVPNPFNPQTTVGFELASPAEVTLVVYNILGQQVATLTDREALSEGKHATSFDASSLPSGVYYYSLSALTSDGNPVFRSTRKMILVR